jgi:hypothetical protein
MRLTAKAFVLVCLLVVACSVPELWHLLRFGHLAPLGLHADVIVRKTDYGIPGISKTYEPQLTNFSVTPQTVTVCKVKDDWDSPSYVTRIGNSIEKWHSGPNKWEDIFSSIDKPHSCPGDATTKRLWPLQSVSGGEVAVAGYDIFAIGDKARFIVFLGDGRVLATSPIVIDEHQTVAGDFRVR